MYVATKSGKQNGLFTGVTKDFDSSLVFMLASIGENFKPR